MVRRLGVLGVRSVLGALGVALTACDSRLLDYCENSLREYYPAPNGARQAVVFDRSCGRSPSTTNLSVLTPGASIPDETGNTYSVEGAVVLGVEWTGPAELSVLTPAGARALKQDTLVNDVRLRYRERPRADTAKSEDTAGTRIRQ